MAPQLADFAVRIIAVAVLVSAVASGADAATSQSIQALSGDPTLDYAPDSVLIRFKPAARPAQKQQAYDAVGGRKLRGYGLVRGLEHVEIGRGQQVEQAIERLRRLPFIDYVEPDQVLRANTNDTYYGLQWGLNNTGQVIRSSAGTPDADIDAEEAWGIVTGNPDFVVAVIDTGTDYTHPDLDANIWTNLDELNGIGGVDDDGNGYIDDIHGYDFWSNDPDPMDGDGHGTHTAGTICAEGNNGQGVAGVVWQCRIMALRFLGPNGGYTSDAISALDYALAKGVKVSNNSWGGGGFSQSLFNAIQNAGAQGHLFVAAAGNSSINTDSSAHYPSSYDLGNIIAVAATDKWDQLSSFSNYGATTVDIGAPGTDIASTAKGGYYWMSGTSMAAPHVAGLAALIWDLHPEYSHLEVRDRIYNTVRPLTALYGITVTGGIINAYEAVLDPVSPPAAPTDLSVTAASHSEIDLAWADNANNESGYRIERSTDGSSWTEIATAAMDSTAYTDSGLQAERLYHYRVRAYNGAGESAYSNTASDTTNPIPMSQEIVASGETPGGGTVEGNYLDTWTVGGNMESITERLSGGKKPDRYSYLEHTWTFQVPPGMIRLTLDATSGTSLDGDAFEFSYSLDGTNFSDISGFPADANGLVYIRVTDTDRTPGHQSLDTVSVDYIAIMSEQMDGSPPAAPTGLAATATGSGIDLEWTDTSTDEHGFEINRSMDGSSWTTLTTVGADNSSYSDGSVSSGAEYWYRVRAYNGSGYSGYSNEASATTAPSAGISLTATGYKVKGWQNVDLAWGGASGEVTIYRDNDLLATGPSEGTDTDANIAKGGGSYSYQVCETAGTANCSDPVQVVF